MSNEITLTLPDGTTAQAVIRTAEEVPERLRRAYLEAQSRMLKDSGADVGDNGKVDLKTLDVVAMGTSIGPVRDALILSYVKSWTLKDDQDGPLPLSQESIMDLPGGVYDQLHDAADVEYKKAKGGQVDTSIDPDADSPTEPLAGSVN